MKFVNIFTCALHKTFSQWLEVGVGATSANSTTHGLDFLLISLERIFLHYIVKKNDF